MGPSDSVWSKLQARKRYLRKLAEVRYLGLGGWREDNKRKTPQFEQVEKPCICVGVIRGSHQTEPYK